MVLAWYGGESRLVFFTDGILENQCFGVAVEGMEINDKSEMIGNRIDSEAET